MKQTNKQQTRTCVTQPIRTQLAAWREERNLKFCVLLKRELTVYTTWVKISRWCARQNESCCHSRGSTSSSCECCCISCTLHCRWSACLNLLNPKIKLLIPQPLVEVLPSIDAYIPTKLNFCSCRTFLARKSWVTVDLLQTASFIKAKWFTQAVHMMSAIIQLLRSSTAAPRHLLFPIHKST